MNEKAIYRIGVMTDAFRALNELLAAQNHMENETPESWDYFKAHTAAAMMFLNRALDKMKQTE